MNDVLRGLGVLFCTLPNTGKFILEKLETTQRKHA
jgi:hypothetical protein